MIVKCHIYFLLFISIACTFVLNYKRHLNSPFIGGIGMKKVGKDDFISGFVPHHNHGSVDYTSVASGHVHQCLDVTSPPIPSEDGSHIHYTEGYVVFEDGHNHHYKAYSGPAIPVGNGMHVHYYDFYTTENDHHRHHVKGVDQPAPGNK